jgi:hypothetical protein
MRLVIFVTAWTRRSPVVVGTAGTWGWGQSWIVASMVRRRDWLMFSDLAPCPIGHDAARALDRYIRARSRHAQAWRPQLWLGVSNRGPMTASGIYQMISRRGRQCGLHAWPHRFRHHFSQSR